MKINNLNDLRTFHSKFLHKIFKLEGLGSDTHGVLRDITFPRYSSDELTAIQAVLTIENIATGQRSTTTITLKDLEYGLRAISPDNTVDPVPAPPFTLSGDAIIRTPTNSNFPTITARMPSYSQIKNVTDLVKSTPITLQILKGDGHITSEFTFESVKRVPHTNQFSVSLFSTQFRFTIEITSEDIQQGRVQRKEMI